MDVAIGEGRAVVQDKFLRAGALRLDFFVKPAACHFSSRCGSRADEVGLHGKAGLGQIQCIFIVHLQRLKGVERYQQKGGVSMCGDGE